MSQRKLGLVHASALVFGNVVGSGVFLLPASLAAYGGYGLGGWLLTSLGAMALALVFASLGRVMPIAGGPYAYVRRTLGDFAGFQVAWGYWIAMWSGNAAIAVAFVGYFGALFPSLAAKSWGNAAIGLVAIWTLTLVNARGVRVAGTVQVVTSALKLLPLLAIAAVGLVQFRPSMVPALSLDLTPLQALSATAALTLWAFLGLESATVPADSIETPERTIPRATLLGTGAAAVLYIASTLALFALIPTESLAASTAPFADAAGILWGPVGATLIAAGAAISAFGTLNGWILLQGQLPQAAARDGLFPSIFARQSGRGTPIAGLLIGSSLQTALLLMNYSEGLVAQFTFIILLATLANLIPYAFASAALLDWTRRQGAALTPGRRRGLLTLGFLGFFYSLAAIAGAGAEAVFWGFLLLLLGVPCYVWQNGRRTTTVADP